MVVVVVAAKAAEPEADERNTDAKSRIAITISRIAVIITIGGIAITVRSAIPRIVPVIVVVIIIVVVVVVVASLPMTMPNSMSVIPAFPFAAVPAMNLLN